MEHVHYEFTASGGNVAVVAINHQANVLLLDPNNYHSYCHGRSYHYFGGWRTASPVRLRIPHSGHWHIAIDLAGHSGVIQSSLHVL